MTYQFHYSYANDTWNLGYSPESPIGYPDAEYDLPGVVPDGDWTLYAEMYGVTDGAAVGLQVKMDDDSVVALLACWNFNPEPEPGGENIYIKRGTAQVWLKIEYHSGENELHLSSATTEGSWVPMAVVPVATPVDTGLLLRYDTEGRTAQGYLTGVALLAGLEEPDGLTDLQLAPTVMSAAPVVQPALTLGNEPTVYGLMGAPFGDLEFDIGKSARWLEYFSDKMFVLDVNLGDPRYWIVNWAITFPDAEHAVTSINFFERPADFRRQQFLLADKQYHIEDDAWVYFVDGTEGLSFDNDSLPDDYDFNPFMSFIYREIARAEAANQTSVVFPFFVFLRSDEVQNVTYDHFANFDDGSFSLLQPVSVPYYLPYQGLRRMFRADVLRNPSFDWSSLDRPDPASGPPATLQGNWNWDTSAFTAGSEAYGDAGLVGETPETATHVAISAADRNGNPQSSIISQLEAGDQLTATDVSGGGAFITFNVTDAPFLESPTIWWVPVTHWNGTIEPNDGGNTRLNFLLTNTPSPVKAQIVSYAYAHWNIQDIPPGAVEPPPLSEQNDDGFRMRKRISQVRAIASLPVGAWDPAADPAGVPGPWAKYITTNTDPDFDPITDTPVTEPDPVAAGIKTPLYDCVIRLNMRDGVWYEGDVSGNTPMMWDSINGKWQTSYDPDTWPDLGVRAGDNPMYNDPQSPVPPVPTPE